MLHLRHLVNTMEHRRDREKLSINDFVEILQFHPDIARYPSGKFFLFLCDSDSSFLSKWIEYMGADQVTSLNCDYGRNLLNFLLVQFRFGWDRRNLSKIKMILEAGVDPNFVDKCGQTALDVIQDDTLLVFYRNLRPPRFRERCDFDTWVALKTFGARNERGELEFWYFRSVNAVKWLKSNRICQDLIDRLFLKIFPWMRLSKYEVMADPDGWGY